MEWLKGSLLLIVGGIIVVIEYLTAFFLIFMAEMGDKTQILAMTFATKYTVKQVLIGVAFGSLVNHGMAVALGSYLSNMAPLALIRIIAAFLFIGFGLWTLAKTEDDEDSETRNSLGPVVTVATAFFIGELGDKTQLATITLATSATYPLFILMGTVSGMVLTSALGIYIGSRFGKRIPEFTMKIASASIFILFGLFALYDNVAAEYLTTTNIIYFVTGLATILLYLIRAAMQAQKARIVSPFRHRAEELHKHISGLRTIINDLCLGEGACKNCQGNNCLVGFSKELLTHSLTGSSSNQIAELPPSATQNHKNFDLLKAREGLCQTIVTQFSCELTPESEAILNATRQNFERICFHKTLPFTKDADEYIQAVVNESPVLATRLRRLLDEERNQ